MEGLTVRLALWIMSIFYTTSPKTGWKSLGIISVSDLHAQVRKLALSVITGVLLVSIKCIYFYRLSRSFAEKIHTVTAAMKKPQKAISPLIWQKAFQKMNLTT